MDAFLKLNFFLARISRVATTSKVTVTFFWRRNAKTRENLAKTTSIYSQEFAIFFGPRTNGECKWSNTRSHENCLLGTSPVPSFHGFGMYPALTAGDLPLVSGYSYYSTNTLKPLRVGCDVTFWLDPFPRVSFFQVCILTLPLTSVQFPQGTELRLPPP